MAKAMREKFGEALDLRIFANDCEEAKAYRIKASTTVLLDKEWVPLEVATSKDKMEEVLKERVYP